MLLNIRRIFVAELVAVVITHAAVIVDVAACAFRRVRLASAVTLPDIAVVLAVVFFIVSPALSLNWVVLAPPRNKASALDGVVSTPATEMVVLAVPPKVDTPVTPSVPFVNMLVLMVVAAWAMPALTKTTASARIVVRAPLPRLFRYDLMLFINVVKVLYCKRINGARAPLLMTILLENAKFIETCG
jgi:hypothetical protein